MEMITVSDKTGLVAHRAAIESLFLECFGDRLSSDLWEWAYLQNPHGEPVVSLFYDQERLVGHYAIVPMPLAAGAATLASYLSMTTMVATSHRQHGLFIKLAAATYERARELNIDIVMGFPNAASTPGVRKRLEWTRPEPDYVAAVSKDVLLLKSREISALGAGAYALDLHHTATRNWRMARPGGVYVWADGLMYKQFGEAIDLMYFDKAEALEQLPAGATINLLLAHDCGLFREQQMFEYQFGGIAVSSAFDPAVIQRQMCLSDVF